MIVLERWPDLPFESHQAPESLPRNILQLSPHAIVSIEFARMQIIARRQVHWKAVGEHDRAPALHWRHEGAADHASLRFDPPLSMAQPR
jgi:hypothetical protein